MTERTDAEELAQLTDVARTLASPGWVRIVQVWGLQREMMIREFVKAPLEGTKKVHGAEFYQGQLAGFETAVKVVENLGRQIEDKAQEQKEKDLETK